MYFEFYGFFYWVLPNDSSIDFVRYEYNFVPFANLLQSYNVYNEDVLAYAVVTPLRKAASYEPRIPILLGILGDTWLTRGKYGIYVAVRGSYGALTGST